MNHPRSSGILLHPTSLPGPFGVGDLGEEANRFADFLAESGLTVWQVLPLGPTGFGDSPYQSFSAFAGNTLLISPQLLVAEGLIDGKLIQDFSIVPSDRTNYRAALDLKRRFLQRAFETFKRAGRQAMRNEFDQFCIEQEWLEDYALYRAIKDARKGVAWNSWEPELASRKTSAILDARNEMQDIIEAEKFYQYLFFKQWKALKAYCNGRGVSIIGDIPIFVAHDSVDVWRNPDQFKLDEDGNPTVVSGVPPDYFSATGQLWGNPLYRWEAMRADGFQWWLKRIRDSINAFDFVRIDHFRGFSACWEIPGGDKTAERGKWVPSPGRELFTVIKNSLGDLPILAEDLGVITRDVERLRDEFEFPGMRILQFAFHDDPNSNDLPHNYISNAVVYTGTHDNDTTVGWFNSVPGAESTRDAARIERERNHCLRYLNSDGREISWDFIRAALASVAKMAIFPLQDALSLGNTARMNLPGSTSGNWTWRYEAGDLSPEISGKLRQLTHLYGRTNSVRERV